MRIKSFVPVALMSICLTATLSACGSNTQDTNQQQSTENNAVETQSSEQTEEVVEENDEIPLAEVNADNIEELLKEQVFYCEGFKVKDGNIYMGTVFNNSDVTVEQILFDIYVYDDSYYPVSLDSSTRYGWTKLSIDGLDFKPGEVLSTTHVWKDVVSKDAKSICAIVESAWLPDGTYWINELSPTWVELYSLGNLPELLKEE